MPSPFFEVKRALIEAETVEELDLQAELHLADYEEPDGARVTSEWELWEIYLMRRDALLEADEAGVLPRN